MNVVAGEGVEVAGQRRHQRFAFARFHLGDVAIVERHAADELHVEVAHAERTYRCFADCCKCFGQNRIEALAAFETFPKLNRQMCELNIVELLHVGLERADMIGNLLVVLNLSAFAERKEFGEKSRHLICRPVLVDLMIG